MKRLSAFILTIVLLLNSFSGIVFACDESQTNIYICQILFGDSAIIHSSDEKVKMMLNALYLCSEQADGLGQEKIDYLRRKRVSKVPALSDIDLKSSELLECSHNSWEHDFSAGKESQENRKKVLQNTVNKVFNFGFLNKLFKSNKGKCDSFAAMLYYTHLLADYLADDPAETETNVGGKLTPAYSGMPYVIINGNKPSFTLDQKKRTDSFIKFSSLDNLGRAGIAFANIGSEIVESVGERQSMTHIKPSGWSNKKDDYVGIVNSQPPFLYNRCHLLAHSLGGIEEEINLVTGTRYMNESGMKQFEDKVTKYVKRTGNHVLYRSTPVFKGDNRLVSGVQIEAYSVEDSGEGICFNVFCYNVQPGVDLNYITGDNEVSDMTISAKNILPFAVDNAGAGNPDLIFELNKHLDILFKDQISSGTYNSMKNEIASIAAEARAVGRDGEKKAQYYIALKEYEYQYFDVLKSYIPVLLQKEKFFTSAFKQ